MFCLTVRRSTLDVRIRQDLTSKVDPRAVRVNSFSAGTVFRRQMLTSEDNQNYIKQHKKKKLTIFFFELEAGQIFILKFN